MSENKNEKAKFNAFKRFKACSGAFTKEYGLFAIIFQDPGNEFVLKAKFGTWTDVIVLGIMNEDESESMETS